MGLSELLGEARRARGLRALLEEAKARRGSTGADAILTDLQQRPEAIVPDRVEAEPEVHEALLEPQGRQRQQAQVLFASPTEISMRSAVKAFSGTSFEPERRAELARNEFAETMNKIYADMMRAARTDAERKLVQEEMEGLKSAFRSAYDAWLGARGRTTSWMITGRSGRNEARERKKHQTATRRMRQMRDVLEKGQARILKKLQAMRREQAGGVLGELRAKLRERETRQQMMKKANAMVRAKVKLTAQQQAMAPSQRARLIYKRKVDRLVEELGLRRTQAEKILEPDFMGRIGFTDYQLKNNNAEIRRLKRRIAEQQRKQERAELARAMPLDQLSYEFEGSEKYPYAGTIEYDHGENRIRLSFHERIPREVFQEIRRTTGFNWSRRHQAFSAIMGTAAVNAARRITGRDDLPYPEQLAGRTS